jgi:DNA polymerase I-like protein with 3'-5' exonuclease and polymerase domains
MEQAYRKGIDLHTFAAKNLSLDESKLPEGVSARFVAKQLNFLALYGGGIKNFQASICKFSNIWLDDEVCSTAFKQWKEGFSDIKDWHERNARKRNRLDKTISGRRYKAKTYTELNNIKNQGTGAEVAKLAMHYMFKHKIINEREGIYLVNFIHDAYVIECDNSPDIYKKVAKGMALCMQKAWFEVMKQAPIKNLPMPVDVLVGFNWGDIEEEKNIIYSYHLEGIFMLHRTIEQILH